jgi:hypothetical protein
MKAVKFLMSFTVGALFNEGEIAGFDDAIADDLIERKIAEAVKDTKTDKGGKSGKGKAGEPVDPATLDDAALDALIADEQVQIAEGADRAAKIEAVLASRKK